LNNILPPIAIRVFSRKGPLIQQSSDCQLAHKHLSADGVGSMKANGTSAVGSPHPPPQLGFPGFIYDS